LQKTVEVKRWMKISWYMEKRRKPGVGQNAQGEDERDEDEEGFGGRGVGQGRNMGYRVMANMPRIITPRSTK
jgi:hypothetical protein